MQAGTGQSQREMQMPLERTCLSRKLSGFLSVEVKRAPHTRFLSEIKITDDEIRRRLLLAGGSRQRCGDVRSCT